MKIVLMIITGIIRNNATAQHTLVTILQCDFMIFTLAFCFSDLFWYILRWANDSMHKILQPFIISYFLCICKTKYIIFLQFHQFHHFVFEGTKTGGLSAEYVCYGLLFLCLTKSVMNTRTRANGLTCLLTITYPAIILRLLSYSIIQRWVQQKCNMGTEKLKNSFSITIAIPWIGTLPIFRNIQATRIGR